MVLDRLQRNWNPSELPEIDLYFLDLISYREISNKIAEVLNVWHQSPQIIVIKNGKCIYEASHFSISFKDITKNMGWNWGSLNEAWLPAVSRGKIYYLVN